MRCACISCSRARCRTATHTRNTQTRGRGVRASCHPGRKERTRHTDRGRGPGMKRYESAEPRYTSLKKCQMHNYLATLISCAALPPASRRAHGKSEAAAPAGCRGGRPRRPLPSSAQTAGRPGVEAWPPSSHAAPRNWKPIGKRVSWPRPMGTEMAGRPSRLARKMCRMSDMIRAVLDSPVARAAGVRRGAVRPAVGPAMASSF